jgi:hypothetical protein
VNGSFLHIITLVAVLHSGPIPASRSVFYCLLRMFSLRLVLFLCSFIAVIHGVEVEYRVKTNLNKHHY